MSTYPVWWNETLTIYNRYEDAQTHVVTWFRHVVTNCFWKDAGVKVTVGNTVLETNDLICRIPEKAEFLPYFEWVAKPSDVKPNYFTLSYHDIIVRGAVDDVINEYSTGHHSSDLLNKYKALQGCMQINKFAINTGVGRGEPHYYVRGV